MKSGRVQLNPISLISSLPPAPCFPAAFYKICQCTLSPVVSYHCPESRSKHSAWSLQQQRDALGPLLAPISHGKDGVQIQPSLPKGRVCNRRNISYEVKYQQETEAKLFRLTLPKLLPDTKTCQQQLSPECFSCDKTTLHSHQLLRSGCFKQLHT